MTDGKYDHDEPAHDDEAGSARSSAPDAQKRRGGRKRKSAEDKASEFSGALKCEIIKPVEETWDDVGARLRALLWAEFRTLNEAAREMLPSIKALEMGEVNPKTGKRWKEGDLESRLYTIAAQTKKEGEGIFHRILAMDERASASTGKDTVMSHAPFLAANADASCKVILSRLTKQPLAALRNGTASYPSWKFGTPIVSTIFNQRGSVAIPIDVLKLLLEEAGYTLGKPWP